MAEANDIPAAVVVNKVDLARAAHSVERCRRAGYPVFPTSVVSGAGLAEFAAALTGRTSIVTGPRASGSPAS